MVGVFLGGMEIVKGEQHQCAKREVSKDAWGHQTPPQLAHDSDGRLGRAKAWS